MALGTGGVKAALPALGADQFDPKKAKQLSTYFNWFIFSLTIGSILGVTLVVWISTDKGWDWAFAVCAIALLLSIFFISLGNPFYRNNLPKGSPLLRFLRVFVASFRNRKLPIPENADELHEIYQDKEDDNLHHEILQRTDQFKFLDRAAVIRRTEDDDNDGSNSGSEWRVCTVTEVEETKILIRMLPIILTTIFMNTCLAQLQTFSVQQSVTMDRDFIGFEIPGPSVPAIPLLFMFILIPLYDRVFVPIARRVTGIPTGISHLQRIGIGLVLSAISMTVAGFVEKKRRNVAIQHDMVDSQDALPISVFWLGYQYAIFGAADMFTLVGMLEFFYAESSAGMKALSTAISWCSLAFGYYLSSVVVEIVNKETMNSRDFEVGSKSSNNDETNKNKALISKKQGGNRAALFVYATEGLENMAFIAIAVSLVTYFYGYMNYSLTKSSTMLTNFMGTSFLLALVGGFICDTYLTRFKTCLIFASFELLGYTLLLVQAHRSELRPPKCVDNINHQCVEATTGEASILYVGLYLVALGTGGIKAALPSLGADQFDERDPKESSQLSSFFNWFLFSLTIGAIFGVTVVVWISTNKGWDRGFAVCLVAVFFALLSLTFGKSLYRHNVPKGSPLLRFIRVFVASIKNRKLPIPENSDELYEIGEDKEAAILNNHQEFLQRTDQFKCLDRAAVIRTDGITGKWRVCTVTEVEETKILVRMLPIILSTVFMNTCLAQLQTFSVQQGTTMDTTINGFEVPAASIQSSHSSSCIRHLQRIGVGLVLSAISMTVAGIVEKKRKNVAIEHGMVDSLAPLPISLLWLGFQYAIFGAADMFTLVGLLEFFYAESSAGMKSLSTAISWCSFAFGYYLSTVVVEIVNKVSGGWLANNNLNRDKLEYFYWLLAGLSVVNFGVYVLCASWYRYKKLEVPVVEKNDVLKEIKP
ncbi:hypothetical protein F8388_013803 [Cannabis sativa]|uniref:Uncharacterized protein n=1 Tax=Cannabis sativa TaxID=3483 RepID=A0A7J6E581_CANSA|nr:hypothetical protein F8388_013803 [Cannabis sativa]